MVLFTINISYAQKVMTPTEPPKGVKLATTEDIQNLLKAGNGTIFDVRWHYSEYVFEGHIPGAVSVPFTEYSALATTYDISEDSWDWSQLPADKARPIAFYCMGDVCWKSYKVAEEAAKRGHTQVMWYRGGQPEWDAKKLPVESRNPAYESLIKVFSGSATSTLALIEPVVLNQWYDEKQNMKLIDLRYISFFEEGRLEQSLNVPLNELMSRDGIQMMPAPAQKVKIVLISENGQHAAAAVTALNLLGYDAYVLNGGLKGWKAAFGQKHMVKGKLEVNSPGGKGWKGQLLKLPKGSKN
jgi:rhodanese-related sulfurtransferase